MLHNNQTTKNMSDMYVKEEENINIIKSYYSFSIDIREITHTNSNYKQVTGSTPLNIFD